MANSGGDYTPSRRDARLALYFIYAFAGEYGDKERRTGSEAKLAENLPASRLDESFVKLLDIIARRVGEKFNDARVRCNSLKQALRGNIAIMSSRPGVVCPLASE